jgi:arylsulfatase A-like enzyme
MPGHDLSRRQFLHAAAGAWAGRAQRPTNVVVILTDDQGYGDLACHGNPLARTPHLDRLHAESTRLTDFHVDPTCSPSRSALLTGRYSHRVGVWHTVIGRNFLRRGEVTMAEVFREAGYRTGHFGKWHLGANYPFRPIDRGFERWVGHGNGGIGTSSDYWDNQKLNDTYYRDGAWEKFSGFSTDIFVDEAMRFIREAAAQPFFVYLATNVPHAPLNLPAAWLKPWGARTRDPQFARLYASIERIDWNVGRLLRMLAQRRQLDNTLVIFLTDNGAATGAAAFAAGMRGRKGDIYEGGHRVPCFLRWPGGGLRAGLDVARLTAHVDLLPTLIDLCGLQRPGGVAFDGASLAPLLRDPGAAWPERTLLVESQRIQYPEKWRNCAMMRGRWRLVNGLELYDLRADPAQQRDVAGAHPDLVRRLRAGYEELWDSLSARDRELERPLLGNGRQPLTWFAPDERFAELSSVPVFQDDVRRAKTVEGIWAAAVETEGLYEFAVRRWPREVRQPLTAALPEIRPDGVRTIHEAPVPPGRALSLVHARFRAGERRAGAAIPPGAEEVRFAMTLPAGPVDLQACFADAAGDETRGAYYIYARRLQVSAAPHRAAPSASSRARANTAANISSVRRPVCVFCWLG